MCTVMNCASVKKSYLVLTFIPMKKLLLLILLSPFTSVIAGTNTLCGSGRYDTEIFSNVDTTNDILYGANYVAGGNITNLTMDIYQPQGDTLSMRPLIVFAHGGSFIAGSKEDADVTSLCQHFARRGYVCASINYRLGFAVFPPNSGEAKRAVYRSVQDMKAAIRFFRKDAATTNAYRIDPNIIFAGGSSAGAFAALHMAYLDEYSELPADIDTSVMGNMEGNSGNPGYSSEVNAIINLCGALGDKTWIHSTDEPLVSMHGTADGTVPYATDIIVMFGIVPIMQVDGSYSISDWANTIGLQNDMYTFYGADHVPYLSSTQYMDTTVGFVSNFLYRYLGCTPSDPNPLGNTFNTGIDESLNRGINVYPNPSNGIIRIDSDEPVSDFYVYDLSGKQIFHRQSLQVIDLSFEGGIYLYKAVINSTKIIQGKLVIER
jgi:para-nitrobenzyl esterase